MSDGTTDTERRWWLCDKCGAGGFVDEGPVRCDDDECPITWAFRENTGAQTASSPSGDAGTAGAAAGDEGRATQPRHSITTDTERLAEIRERIARLATDPDVAPYPELADRFLSRIIAERDAEIAQLKQERDRLADQVYVPGLWRCKKCDFTLFQGALRASDGAVGVRDDPGEMCPNCSVPLWRVTERQAGNDMVDRADEYLKRAQSARREALEEAAIHCNRTATGMRNRARGDLGSIFASQSSADLDVAARVIRSLIPQEPQQGEQT